MTSTQQMPAKASDQPVEVRSAPVATSGNGAAAEGTVQPYAIEGEQQWAFNSDGVDADRRAEIALDVIRSQRSRWARVHRRPSALRPRDALQALVHEVLVIVLADPANPDDRKRQLLAGHRILTLVAEVTGDVR